MERRGVREMPGVEDHTGDGGTLMPNVIWKFQCPIRDWFTLTMPAGAVPLSVGAQTAGDEEILCLWALVDRDAPCEQHQFLLCGTGHPTAPVAAVGFIGTVQMPS